MGAQGEVKVLEARRRHPDWGPRRIVFELGKGGLVVSESGVYRALRRAGLIEATRRRPRDRRWKRWERAEPNELWQLDVVGGSGLADGSVLKCLTGVDDHSRFCVSAYLMFRERTQPVCDGFALALRSYGVPQQVLTDNGRVFTGRFNQPPVEVLFDRICRENGIEHLLTRPRSPTTTGKIERFHRSLRQEFLTGRLSTPPPRPKSSWISGWPPTTMTVHTRAWTWTPRPSATHTPGPTTGCAGARPNRAGVGGPQGLHRGRGLRLLAAGLSRQAPCRGTVRCPRRPRSPAVLDRQRTAAHG
jgi:transposase InsO family protein